MRFPSNVTFSSRKGLLRKQVEQRNGEYTQKPCGDGLEKISAALRQREDLKRRKSPQDFRQLDKHSADYKAYLQASASKGLWSRGSHQGALPEVAKLQRQGGKSAGREKRPQLRPSTLSGKEGVANEQQL